MKHTVQVLSWISAGFKNFCFNYKQVTQRF